MYGTVNEICLKLLSLYKPDEKMAVIVWTAEIVSDFIGDREVTDDEVATIVEGIDRLDGLHEYGVSAETLHAMVDNIQEAKAQRREISVNAVELAKIMALAGEYVRQTDTEGGEGATQRLWPEQVKALETLRALILA